MQKVFSDVDGGGEGKAGLHSFLYHLLTLLFWNFSLFWNLKEILGTSNSF